MEVVTWILFLVTAVIGTIAQNPDYSGMNDNDISYTLKLGIKRTRMRPNIIYIYFFIDVLPPGCCQCSEASNKTSCSDLLAFRLEQGTASDDEFCNIPSESTLFCAPKDSPTTNLFVKDFCRVTCNNPPGRKRYLPVSLNSETQTFVSLGNLEQFCLT